MVKRFGIVLLLLLSLSATVRAQRENNVWYFGQTAGLDFITDPPTAILGPLNVEEGTATICDPVSGQLLFSSEGRNIYDKFGGIMQGGAAIVGGGGTATQGVTIVPFPLDRNKYLVIGCDQSGYSGPNRGVSYSVVDMSQTGGLGAVVVKNQLLLPPLMSEKLTAVPHANGCDIWIVAHGLDSIYYALQFSGTAFNPTPMRSIVGHSALADPSAGIGWLVASRKGDMLAYVSWAGVVELANFDNQTGKVSNVERLVDGSNELYGAAFSPDGTKLYVSSFRPAALWQFDLSRPTLADIQASKRDLGATRSVASIRPGPDDKLYVALPTLRSLGVIALPNDANATFVEAGVTLGAPVKQGLPNILDAMIGVSRKSCLVPLLSILGPNRPCVGDCNTYSLTNAEDMSARWFVDGEERAAVNAVDVCYTSPGTHSVRVVLTNAMLDTLVLEATRDVKPQLYFSIKPSALMSDTIGATVRIPIVLSDTVSAAFRAEVEFDPERLTLLGAFDAAGNKIDSAVADGHFVAKSQLTGSAQVGYLLFDIDWSDLDCRRLRFFNWSLSGISAQCLLDSSASDVCLDAACGTRTIASYMKNRAIKFILSPNPSKGFIDVATSSKLHDVQIVIYTLAGKEIYARRGLTLDLTPTKLEVSNVAAGAYLVALQAKDYRAIKLLMLVR